MRISCNCVRVCKVYWYPCCCCMVSQPFASALLNRSLTAMHFQRILYTRNQNKTIYICSNFRRSIHASKNATNTSFADIVSSVEFPRPLGRSRIAECINNRRNIDTITVVSLSVLLFHPRKWFRNQRCKQNAVANSNSNKNFLWKHFNMSVDRFWCCSTRSNDRF